MMIATKILTSKIFAPPPATGLTSKVENGAMKGSERLSINWAKVYSTFYRIGWKSQSKQSRRNQMMYETTKNYLATLSLDVESQVHADLALALAARYDEKGETSTAGELRKTLNELKVMIGKPEQVNPLRELLKR
jgi:hypothetical protein